MQQAAYVSYRIVNDHGDTGTERIGDEGAIGFFRNLAIPDTDDNTIHRVVIPFAYSERNKKLFTLRPSPTFAAKVGESGSKGVNHARTGRVVIHERSVGIQRSSSNALTARRCDVVSSGAIITVARRPGPPVVVRTSVARIAARSPIIARAESPVPSAIFARLTSISPSTVAKVCRRMDPSAH